MDHRRIEEENVAELYATGRLPPEDEQDFEVHLLECRECRERVSQADDFRDSIRTVAAEDAARATQQIGLLAALAWKRRAARIGLGLALLLLAVLPAWLLLDRMRLERELAEIRKTMERPPSQVPVPGPPPPVDGQELERLAQERSRLEEELRQERTARETLAGRIAEMTRPQVNTAVYALGLVRGETEAGEIELPPTPAWIVLSIELPQASHETYRATLLDARGATVWRGDGLRPTASDTLTVLLYSDLLQSGAYRLRVEGVEEGGRAVPAGEIPFRTRRQG
jgi:hypothetical protein